ncbi:MAG: TIGR00266 family protein, partial [Coprobacillaceae bacterium]
GGIGKALARSFTGGESVFMTTAVAHKDDSVIAIAPQALGTITSIDIDSNNYWYLKDGVFLASDATVELKSKMQKNLSGALFGGTGGLFVLSAHGHGEVLLETIGSLKVVDLNDDELTIDTDHVVAWQESLNYDIEVASGVFGFKSGEGLVTRFSGTGKVLVQSRNLKALASKISKYIVTAK